MIWKSLKFFGLPHHEVSNRGEIRSLPHTNPPYVDVMGRNMPSKVYSKGKILNQRLNNRGSKGYYVISTRTKGGKRLTIYVHILVVTAFHGEKPSKDHLCRHLDGDSYNNDESNLAWGTQKENMGDALAHGTVAMAEKHYASIRTEDDVKEIRARAISGEKLSIISADFNIRESMCYQIATGIKWGSVKGKVYKGRNRPMNKLNDLDRGNLYKDREEHGFTYQALADKYKISQTQVVNIIRSYDDA